MDGPDPDFAGTGDWRARIAALPPAVRTDLAGRARRAPLFAHAYAFHLNLRFGGMAPDDVAGFAQACGLRGVKIHLDDGEERSIGAMTPEAIEAFGRRMRDTGLELHLEISTTAPETLAGAVARARATGATALRFYPRYEGRVSQIMGRTIDDLRHLPRLDPNGRLRFMLEQHEDLTSDELVEIIAAVAHPRLSLLFDFANMINALEAPLPALARQAPWITDVHVKDCLVRPDRGGLAHLACSTGRGHLPIHAMLTELLLLGAGTPQVLAFGLEEEEGYYAPALRRPDDGPDPFIAARSESFTDPGPGELSARLSRERAAARAQIATVRTMLEEIARAAEATAGRSHPAQ